jgi:hypothetical protein
LGFKDLAASEPDIFKNQEDINALKSQKKFKINLRSKLGVVDSN